MLVNCLLCTKLFSCQVSVFSAFWVLVSKLKKIFFSLAISIGDLCDNFQTFVKFCISEWAQIKESKNPISEWDWTWNHAQLCSDSRATKVGIDILPIWTFSYFPKKITPSHQSFSRRKKIHDSDRAEKGCVWQRSPFIFAEEKICTIWYCKKSKFWKVFR